MAVWVIVGLLAIVVAGLIILFWLSAVVDGINRKNDGDYYSLYLDEEDLP